MLTTLVERFHLEHNAFHLLTREMTITPEDIYRIIWIPFTGDIVEYDSSLHPDIDALRRLLHDDTIIAWSIFWDDLLGRYGARYPNVYVLAKLIGCFLLPDRGQQGLLVG